MSTITYRGITITVFDIPAAPYVWIDHETGAHDEAPSLHEAKRQIGQHLGPKGGADHCPECTGAGFEDAAYLQLSPCWYCNGEGQS